MHVLFTHRAFPAQFGRLALELTKRYGWKCSFLIDHLSCCPEPSEEMFTRLKVYQFPLDPRLLPKVDLVVGHSSLVPTAHLPEALNCPLISYCECFSEDTLPGLHACDAGYTPTQWQRRLFPQHLQPKIEVHFDGIDTDLYYPRPRHSASPQVVTYVSRGLEPIRGFDVFMKVAQRLCRERKDVVFLIVGGEETHYSNWNGSFKQWVLSQDDYDLSRFAFLGLVEPAQLADVLCCSDLHFYLTRPFILSWSLLNAMSCGCVVLGSDVEPVREVIEDGRTGLLAPLDDLDRLTKTALRVLDAPSDFQPLGQAARTLMEERYSIDICVPKLRDFLSQQPLSQSA